MRIINSRVIQVPFLHLLYIYYIYVSSHFQNGTVHYTFRISAQSNDSQQLNIKLRIILLRPSYISIPFNIDP